MELLLQNPPFYGIPPVVPSSPASLSVSTLFCSTTTPPRHLRKQLPTKLRKRPSRGSPSSSDEVNLKWLTSRVVRLTRRRQLAQIFEEIEIAKTQHGKLNTIVMNAVMQACVHCRDIESALRVFGEMSKPEGCGVDNVTYGTLLKGLGDARRFDEAFQVLESVEQGTAVGGPQLSAVLICGLLNALIESGDLRRANGLLARYGYVLQEGESPSILTFNLLMKDKAQNDRHCDVSPDLVTYTTLLQGFGRVKDICSVEKILIEMKSCNNLRIDRVAYTAIVDALLNCGSIKGSITSAMQAESDHLLMEAALNQGQVDVALQKLKNIVWRWRDITWSSRGGMVALRLEALMGLKTSMLSPRTLSGIYDLALVDSVSLRDAIEHIMVPFSEASPLQATLQLKQVVMRFFKDSVVPIIDEWGGCIGIVHREDCNALDAPLAMLMRSPPPCVTSSTSVGYVIDLMLEKRYKMVVIVKYSDFHGISSSSSLRAVGVFTYEHLCKLTKNSSEMTDEQFHLAKSNTNI
ncbi:UNVERIFIED_CONTAM: Pentatricopeptide repeat-containing protein [Sesamum radiatum]|uniref:Pentatricopeptide repeat-containing protein n=1 Tax=Sesamum radiatum TaxID=300843 RepID=A0AAW2JUQ6_SESRA